MTLSASDRARLDLAVKQDDSPYTTFAVSPWSKYVALGAARRSVTPNQVTALSLLVALLAGGCFAVGSRSGYIVGAVLLQLSFGLDCADGQLARFTENFSDLGGWLDAMFDRLKEYAVYAGLAIGSARSGDDVWLLAVAALVLQTVRHAVDSAWAVTPAAVSALDEGVRRRVSGGRRRWHWARKVAILPIGERWLLISVLAAVTSPRIVFAVLIVAGALAAGYMVAARVRRSLRPSDDALAPGATLQLDRMRETGPLAGWIARAGFSRPAAAIALPLLAAAVLAAALVAAVLTGSGLHVLAGAVAFVLLAALGGRRPASPRWGWLVPPLLRTAEYATVGVAAWVSRAGPGPVTYAYLLVVIWHHYDSVYRERHRIPATGLSVLAGLGGFEVRTLAVAGLAAVGVTAYTVGIGASAYTVGIATMAGSLAVVAVVRGVDMWQRSRQADVRSAEGEVG
jgi:phosphatidylglycerophosphate synthase